MNAAQTKRQLKVCNISPQGYTGIAYYDYSFCRSLQESGADVHLVTSRRWLAEGRPVSFVLKTFFVNTYGERSRIVKGLNYLLGCWKTFFYVLKEKIPLVHYQLLELPAVDIWFFRLFRWAGVRIVYTPHDIYNFKYTLSKKMIQKFFRLSDCVLAHNRANRELLHGDFGVPESRLKMIRQGNMNDFLRGDWTRQQARRKVGLPQDKPIVLFFGNIREGKGADTAACAMADVLKKKDALFVMAGKPMRGYDLSVIETALKEAVGQGRAQLRFHFIEDKDVEAYYRCADIVLVPYERIYTSAVFCYALSCGCATVISDVKEFADFARDGDNTLLFRAGDAGDLAEKVIRLLEDSSLREAIGRNAKRCADEEWSWDKTAETLRVIYQGLLA